MLDTTQSVVTVGGGAVVIIGALVGWLRHVRPRVRTAKAEFRAARDAIVGREATYDSITGREIQPPLPGVGVRLAGLEESSASLAEAIGRLADSHVRLDNHEDRIKRLEEASVERIVARSESARAWAAMEAATLATPDQTVENDD